MEWKAAGTPEAEVRTAVDLAAQDVLLRILFEVLPDVQIDAEECTDTLRLFSGTEDRPIVVIDPIDGSAAYCQGSDRYAVMAGLIDEGRFAASVVHFPALDRTLIADGTVLEVLGSGVSAAPPLPKECDVLVTPWMGARFRDALAGPEMDLSVRSSRCSAVDGAAPVLGVADGAVCDGCADRRRALALFISHTAGHPVMMGGRVWTGEDPIELDRRLFSAVARDEALMRTLQNRLPELDRR